MKWAISLNFFLKNTDTISFVSYEREEEGILKGKKASKKDDLEKLMLLFDKQLKTKKYELTQLITNFYVDFINMNIFTKHSDLVAFIMLYALIAKDFSVFKYISFFKFFNKEFEGWKSGIITASYYWSSGFAQTDMLSRILLQILISSL